MTSKKLFMYRRLCWPGLLPKFWAIYGMKFQVRQENQLMTALFMFCHLLFKRGTDMAGESRKRLLRGVLLIGLATTAPAFGQSDPWSNIAGKAGAAFSGPIAKGFALVAIVVGGLELAFGEGGSRRTIGGVIFGLGMALSAAQFISWLFS